MKHVISPSAAATALACLLLTALLAVAACTSTSATPFAAAHVAAGPLPTQTFTAAQPAPQAPFDTTVITPVESAGAANSD